jgi:hypothetical protein
MKKIQSLGLGIMLAIGSIGVTHGQQYFNTFNGHYAPSKGKQSIIPDNYRIFSASNQGLQSFLHGLSSKPVKEQIIQLPTPEGTYRTFKIWKTSMMEKALQERYPEIETFTAEALDNPQVTAKLDFTFSGFHAMVFNGSQTFFVDPYSDASDGYYMVYYKKDYHRNVNVRMACSVNSGEIADGNGNLPEQIGDELPHLGAKQFGTTQRNYRLALSCTGEYAQAVGGANPSTLSVLSAMTTTMNRVNGIYERELGISMQFIANENNLIYLNPNTDPFTANNNGSTLLGQNSTNTGTVIGSANYDIGHIFSTGGGGIAQLGCVCKSNNNTKAKGVTGSPNPVGDAYDVDYVAHEMGHQFGAEHTFNSDAGSCQGNGEDNVAFEPGSGTTIMAYAGICSNDDIQEHSDAYFHAKSLDQISDFVTTQATTCAVTQTGVSAPVLPAIADTFFIPIGTPFELISPLAVTDSTDTISYCWEQWNLGNFGETEDGSASFTDGPCYRSFTPSMGTVRVFPQIENVLIGNLSDVGMRMPTVSRPLDFKVTARSIYEGFGTFNISEDELHVNVLDSAGPFVVTFPALAADSFPRGGNATVTWNVANTDMAPVNAANVDIFLSVDGGFTYPFTLATAVPNDGSETIALPDTATVTARVKVKGAGNIFFNVSQTNFKIYDTANGVGVRDVTLNNGISVYPNPAKDWINIRNTSGSALTLSLYNVLGQKIWSGSMTKSSAVPVGNLSRGIYYLQLNDVHSGAKAVKSITLQ